LHRVSGQHYGLDHDNFIGATPQPNQQLDHWSDFFREQRLGFQLDLAQQHGYLSAHQSRLAETLLARLANWLPARPPASLLHGDLWGGNWLATPQAGAALIDPAIYYGHREAELAFTELFGGFPSRFYAAYNAAWPLEPGYEERRPLYNLYHLLNHLNLFGAGYLGAVDQILRKYGA
jgi:fructosamine-3-kinase